MTGASGPKDLSANDWAIGAGPRRLLTDRPAVDRVQGSLLLIDVVGFTRLSERLAQFGAAGTEQMISTVTQALSTLTSAVEGYEGDVLLIAGDALLVLFDGADHAERAHAAAKDAKTALARIARVQTQAGTVVLKVSQGLASGEVLLVDAGTELRALLPFGQTMVAALDAQKKAGPGEILVADPIKFSIARYRGSADRPPRDPAPYIPDAVRDGLPSIAYDHEHRIVDTAFVTYADLGNSPTMISRQATALIDRVQRACHTHGVTVTCVEPTGHGLRFMLTAGAPAAHENGTDALLSTVTYLLGGSGVSPAAGMTHGLAFAGVMGDQHRWTWSAMGDCVNVAARLAARAQPGQLLVDENVLVAVKGNLATQPLPAAQVHSRRGAVRPHLVLGPPTEQTAASTSHFIGRTSDIERIGRWLDAPDSRRVVSIEGPAGMGATSTAVHALGDRQRIELRARVDQRLVPFGSLQRELRRLFALPGDAPASVVDRQLTEWISGHAPEVRDELPLLRSALGGVSVGPGSEDPGRQQRLITAVSSLIRSWLGDDGVLFVDRPGLLDASSQLVLRDLAATARNAGPWILIATRSGDPHPIAADVTITLEPLSLADSTLIAATILEQRHQPTAVAAELAERAQGIPRNVIAFASNWSPANADIPHDIESLIELQIDSLPGDLRRLTRYLSVMGDAVPRQLIRDVLSDTSDERLMGVARAFDDPRSLSRLDGLLEVTGGDQIRFVDPMVSEIAYRGLSYRRRRQLHTRTGLLLEARQETHPAILARHFSRGGNPTKAWRWGLRAADSAFAAGAFNESADAYAIAIESSGAAGVDPDVASSNAERWGDSARMAGRFSEASAAYRLAVTGAASGAVPRLLTKRAWVEGDQGQHAVALRLTSKAISAADELPKQAGRRAKAAAYVRRAGVRIRQGNFDQAKTELLNALRFSNTEGDEWSARAHLLMDGVLVDTGQSEQALSHREIALTTYTHIGDWEGVGQALNNYGIDAYWRGDLTEASTWYEQSLEAFERAGDAMGIAMARNNLGEVASDLGDLDQAEQQFTAFLITSARAGNEQFEAHAYMNLAVVLVRRRKPLEALPLLDQAIARFERIAAHHFADQARVHRVEALLDADDQLGAQAALTELLDTPERRASLAPLMSEIEKLAARLSTDQ